MRTRAMPCRAEYSLEFAVMCGKRRLLRTSTLRSSRDTAFDGGRSGRDWVPRPAGRPQYAKNQGTSRPIGAHSATYLYASAGLALYPLPTATNETTPDMLPDSDCDGRTLRLRFATVLRFQSGLKGIPVQIPYGDSSGAFGRGTVTT